MPTLRDLRRQRCLTQEPLAAAVEVSASTVYSAEAGGFQRRSAIVRRLAQVLGVSPTEIVAQAVGDKTAGVNV
jgi:transcriptional regulator with XRE-family HTH domain